MKEIRVLSYKSTGLDPSLASARVIAIEDSPLGSGGFGVAHRSRRFDGRPATPQVIKLLTESKPGIAQRGLETVRELQSRLAKKNAALLSSGTTLLNKYPTLVGVPQLSFEGELEGQTVLGYSANDLTAAGFEEFGEILDDETKANQFQSLDLGSKLAMAAQLVAAFGLLSSELSFIHADIKAAAIFIDLARMRCAIIDYDSGALAESQSDKPLTCGTPMQDWLAPEIIRQLNPAGRQVEVTLLSDVWSVNVAVHYLLFSLHPFFFLSEISDRSMQAYEQAFRWPDADASFPFFNQEYDALHQNYIQFLRTRLPMEIVKKFEFTFNKGYSIPMQRASYNQWETVLRAVENPIIRSFQADRTFVDDALPVRLTWHVVGAARIEIKGLANVTGRGWLDVNVTRNTTFELVLTSFSGQQISKTIRIEVSQAPPVIHFFNCSTDMLTAARPAQLSWRVSGSAQVVIDQSVGDVTGRSNIEVLPRRGTTYTLTATSLFGVSVRAMVRVQVSMVPPTVHLFESDRSLLGGDASATLSWLVSSDADEVLINEVGLVAKSGSVKVRPRRDTVYSLTATSYFGYSTISRLHVEVSKAPPVIEDFKVSPRFLREGADASVRWRVANAEEVFLEPEFGPVATRGEMDVKRPSSGKFQLRAISYFGVTTTKEASITILKKTILSEKQTKLTTKRTLLTSKRTVLARGCTSVRCSQNTPNSRKTREDQQGSS
jgi:serine/threonine protein kinase